MHARLWPLSAAAIPFVLVLCAMTSNPGAPVPECACTDVGGSWSLDNQCSGTYCSNNSLIVDNLSCSSTTSPGPCPVTGTITVNYDSCTVIACPNEYYSFCPQSCDTAVLDPEVIGNGQQVGPSVGACCATNCYYNLDIEFWGGGSTCPGSSIHCRYSHQYQCHS